MSSPKENGSKRKSKAETLSQESRKSQEDNEERRLSSRVKKPKLVYDPSDKQAPYKKINLEDITKSPSKVKASEYVQSEISRKNLSSNSLQKSSISTFCAFCQLDIKKNDSEPHTTCNTCSETYHNACHDPKIGKGVRRAGWQCSKCRPRLKDDIKERKSTSSSQTPSRVVSPVTSTTELQSEEDNEFTGFNDTDIDESKKSGVKDEAKFRSGNVGDVPQINIEKAKKLFKSPYNNAPNSDTIPDVSSWTFNQIHDYFAKLFPKEAYIFKDQEIDGTSLLLMTRSDMFKFNMKLGPALNIYRHIVMLQTRSYDPRKTWM
uniref:CSON001710 protein n=1 Tax=Culicoides sonorensis TaxID=179676 RepID=A0A336MLA6_CULSO